jgi:hypothetical protein
VPKIAVWMYAFLETNLRNFSKQQNNIGSSTGKVHLYVFCRPWQLFAALQ